MKKILTFDNVEIRVFSIGEDAFICRVGIPGDQPEKVNDAFYPSKDLGYLWFR